MHSRRIVALLSMVALSVSLAACGTQKAPGAEAAASSVTEQAQSTQAQTQSEQTQTEVKKDVTLNILAPLDTKVLGEEYVSTFDKVSGETGIKYNLENIDGETYKTKIKVALAGNELPDVFFTWGDSYTIPFIDAKAVLPLNKYFDESGHKFLPSYVNPHSDGNLYTAPFRSNLFYALLYNKEALNKLNVQPPKTWDDILALIDAAKKNDVFAWGIANKDRWQGDLLYDQMVLREDPMAFKNAMSGNAKFTDAPFLEAAKKVKQLVDMGAFQKGYMQASEPELNEMLYAGKIAIYTIGSWAFGPAIENMGDNLGYVPFPKTGADENYLESNTSLFGSLPDGMCVSAKTEFPDEAGKFVIEYSNYINEVLVKKGDTGFVSTDTKPEKPRHPAFDEFVKATESVKNIQPWWYGAVDASIGEPMRDLSHRQFGGDIGPEDFVKELEKVMTAKK